MNKPARKRSYALVGPRVSLGGSQLLFESFVETLDWHEHSFICVLMGVGGPIDVKWKGGERRADVILVPPSWQHYLSFRGQHMSSLYYAPHQRSFGRLCFLDEPQFHDWDEGWDVAYAHWYDRADPLLLLEQIDTCFARTEVPSVDVRVAQVVEGFWRGEGLDDPIEVIAARVGVSTSRLAHLLKEYTGSTLRRLKRGYRFWHAALAMLGGPNFTEVAHEAGFSDAAHFSRTFRNTYGLAPSRILLEATSWQAIPALP